MRRPAILMMAMFLGILLAAPHAWGKGNADWPGSATWINVKGSKARVTKKMQSAQFHGTSKVSVTYDSIRTWPIYDVPALNNEVPTGGTCEVQAYICFFVERKGVVTGGHFEYLRPNHQETKAIHRLHQGFIRGITPQPGEKCFFAILSMDLQECSNLVEAVWPGGSASQAGTATPGTTQDAGNQGTVSTPTGNSGDAGNTGDYPANVDWKKVNGRGARIDKKLNSVSFRGSSVGFSYESLSGWPVKNIKLSSGKGTADVNAYTCFFVVRNGRLTGGKFDWLRVGQKSKGLENIRHGYVTGVKPVSGEVCYFSLLSLDEKHSTDLLPGRWP